MKSPKLTWSRTKGKKTAIGEFGAATGDLIRAVALVEKKKTKGSGPSELFLRLAALVSDLLSSLPSDHVFHGVAGDAVVMSALASIVGDTVEKRNQTASGDIASVFATFLGGMDDKTLATACYPRAADLAVLLFPFDDLSLADETRQRILTQVERLCRLDDSIPLRAAFAGHLCHQWPQKGAPQENIELFVAAAAQILGGATTDDSAAFIAPSSSSSSSSSSSVVSSSSHRASAVQLVTLVTAFVRDVLASKDVDALGCLCSSLAVLVSVSAAGGKASLPLCLLLCHPVLELLRNRGSAYAALFAQIVLDDVLLSQVLPKKTLTFLFGPALDTFIEMSNDDTALGRQAASVLGSAMVRRNSLYRIELELRMWVPSEQTVILPPETRNRLPTAVPALFSRTTSSQSLSSMQRDTAERRAGVNHGRSLLGRGSVDARRRRAPSDVPSSTSSRSPSQSALPSSGTSASGSFSEESPQSPTDRRRTSEQLGETDGSGSESGAEDNSHGDAAVKVDSTPRRQRSVRGLGTSSGLQLDLRSDADTPQLERVPDNVAERTRRKTAEKTNRARKEMSRLLQRSRKKALPLIEESTGKGPVLKMALRVVADGADVPMAWMLGNLFGLVDEEALRGAGISTSQVLCEVSARALDARLMGPLRRIVAAAIVMTPLEELVYFLRDHFMLVSRLFYPSLTSDGSGGGDAKASKGDDDDAAAVEEFLMCIARRLNYSIIDQGSVCFAAREASRRTDEAFVHSLVAELRVVDRHRALPLLRLLSQLLHLRRGRVNLAACLDEHTDFHLVLIDTAVVRRIIVVPSSGNARAELLTRIDVLHSLLVRNTRAQRRAVVDALNDAHGFELLARVVTLMRDYRSELAVVQACARFFSALMFDVGRALQADVKTEQAREDQRRLDEPVFRAPLSSLVALCVSIAASETLPTAVSLLADVVGRTAWHEGYTPLACGCGYSLDADDNDVEVDESVVLTATKFCETLQSKLERTYEAQGQARAYGDLCDRGKLEMHCAAALMIGQSVVHAGSRISVVDVVPLRQAVESLAHTRLVETSRWTQRGKVLHKVYLARRPAEVAAAKERRAAREEQKKMEAEKEAGLASGDDTSGGEKK